MNNAIKSLGTTLLFISSAFCQGQNLYWAASMGGPSLIDVGQSITVDAGGEVYTSGFFNGTADFDPGPGIFTLTSTGGYEAFVSRLDANGNFVWAKSLGGAGDDFGHGIAIDPSGKILNAGYFNGTSDFDPGAGTFTLTSAGLTDIFVSKLNVAGNFVWARCMGGAGADKAYAIVSDANNNVITTGVFEATADLDPGAGSFTVSSNGLEDIFISKLDASGNFVWGKAIGGAGFDVGASVATDISGNIYVTGAFRGVVDFDPGPGTYTLSSSGLDDIFICKLDGSGNLVWAKAMGDVSADGGNGITVDNSGNIFTIGYYDGTVDLDPGPGVYTITASGCFISKLTNGGNFVWARAMEDVDGGQAIDVDVYGNVLSSGFFDGTVDFDPSAGVYNLTSKGGLDVFISKLDSLGNFVWARSVGDTISNIATSIATDAFGSVLVTGNYEGTTDFDPNAGVFNLTSAGGADIFVMKLDNDMVGINESNNVYQGMTIYPNPSDGNFKLSLNKNIELPISITIVDLFGRTLLNLNKILTYDPILSIEVPNGIYSLKAVYKDHVEINRIIKE